MNKAKKRTLLVSIDAACWEYLDPLLSRGHLPHIRRLMDGGVHGTLDSPLPPMTPVAWSSLATGKGPAKHGVYEWVRRAPDSYDFVPCTAKDRVGTPFWDRLAESGIRVGLVNIPFTYPPSRVNGFVICGFDLPESAQEFTYPAELGNEIEGQFGSYQPAVPGSLRRSGDADALFEAERHVQEQQVRIAVAVAERYDVDVLMINLMFLDHANHYLPGMDRVEEAIIHTDSHLGLLLEGFQPDTVLLISDHGSRRIQGGFLLGSWLSDRGYHSWPDHQQMRRDYINWLLLQLLQQEREWAGPLERLARRLAVEVWLRVPSKMEDLLWQAMQKQLPLHAQHYWAIPRSDPQASQVYAGAVAGCLYLNVRGREPSGAVPSEKQQEILTRLSTELSEVMDPATGEPLFTRVHKRDASYPNSHVAQPPDLVLDFYSSTWGLSLQVPPPVVPQEGYFVKGVDGWYGEHSREGVFVFAGRDITVSPTRRSASLLDIPATLLHLHDVPIPNDYDGRTLVELLDSAFVSNQPVRCQAGEPPGISRPAPDYSAAEAAEILDRLRSLGYVA